MTQKFIFVPKREKVVNLVKFPRAVRCLVHKLQLRTHSRTYNPKTEYLQYRVKSTATIAMMALLMIYIFIFRQYHHQYDSKEKASNYSRHVFGATLYIGVLTKF